MSNYKTNTQAVRAGICSDPGHGAVIPPIHLSSTYALPGFLQKGDFDYSRTGNPTRNLLAEALAALEEGEHGIVTATGMAAIHVAVQLLSSEDLLVIPHDCYGGSYRLFVNLAKRGCLKLDVVDQTDSAAFAAALAKKPKMVWLETPSNPLLRIVDIEALSKQAKSAGALVAVDNTFLSPILQKPLNLGADIVVHSTTKYINGHSDVVAGALVTKEKALGEELAWWANCIGVTGSAFDSYLALRGLRTLPVRMKTHQHNCGEIVKFLAAHPAVDKIYYPGLPSHPGHQIAAAQQRGFGAMVSFELNGGDQQVAAFLKALNLFTLAQSLGGAESLINHPASMTHASMDAQAQKTAGISQGLLRLSVGIEDCEDLIADLDQALITSQLASDAADSAIASTKSMPSSSSDATQKSLSNPALSAFW